MRRITSEQMNIRIILQTNTPTRGADGAVLPSWADTYTVRAGRLRKDSREFYEAQKNNSEITDIFMIRHRTGITEQMRVKFGSTYYDIIAEPDNLGDRNRQLALVCKAVE